MTLVRATALHQDTEEPFGWYLLRAWFLLGHEQSGLGCYYDIPGERGVVMTESEALEVARVFELDRRTDERLLSVWKMETMQ